MDHEKFFNELDLIKIIGSENDNGLQGGTVCNRLYNTLVECLAIESKSIEAKLRVLTAALCFYVELRPQHESISPEADAFGHFLFMESSRLVLGIEFHHLPNSNEFKSSFKSSIANLYNRLHDYAIGQVFLVLDWLMANQWSHPTLVAMMKGDDINPETALTYIRSGEYPELFRLRVEMLMESGCDNFAANLVGWCVQSPLFEADAQLRTTHFSLLYKLAKHEALQAQCCQISCCLGKQVLKNAIGRGEDQTFSLFFSYNFLLANWLKADVYCCYKDLLQLWVSLHHQVNGDSEMFIADVHKLSEFSSTQPKLLSAIVSTLALLVIRFINNLIKTKKKKVPTATLR